MKPLDPVDLPRRLVDIESITFKHPKGSRFLINGEPSGNRLALASKGALRAEIRAHGR